MMIKRLFYLIIFILCSSVSQGQQNVHAIRRSFLDPNSSVVLVAAHRASHQQYPENSLDAISDAIRIGVDIIEIDVKVSKDGIPFLMHDHTLDRTTTGKGEAEAFTWEELQRLFIKDKGKQTTYKIPSLEEALALADSKIMVDLDLKTDRVEEVIKIVKKTDTQEFVFFFDSNYELLSRIITNDKSLMIMPRAYSLTQVDSIFTRFDPPVVHIDFSFYTTACEKRIQQHGARVWINALGECDDGFRKGHTKRSLKKLLMNGANIIQTDEPELLLRALEKSGYRTETFQAGK